MWAQQKAEWSAEVDLMKSQDQTLTISPINMTLLLHKAVFCVCVHSNTVCGITRAHWRSSVRHQKMDITSQQERKMGAGRRKLKTLKEKIR